MSLPRAPEAEGPTKMKPLPQLKKRLPVSGLRAILAMILREVSATKRSSGGYSWAILEPVAGIVLMTFVFSFAFRVPPLGDSFALFYATGMLPFATFKDTSTRIAKSLSENRTLLAYPSVVFTDPILARWILITVTHFLIWAIVLGSIMLWQDPRASLDFPKLILAFGLSSALGFGLGVFNCAANLSFPIWERIWNILNRPLFILSTIFYLYETLPSFARDILYYNPLVHLVGFARSGLYPRYEAEYASVIFIGVIALVSAVMGLYFLYKSRSL